MSISQPPSNFIPVPALSDVMCDRRGRNNPVTEHTIGRPDPWWEWELGGGEEIEKEK